MATPIYFYKTKSLNNLKPSSLVAVKEDGETTFSLYVTDKTGIPYPIKDNEGGGGGGILTITNTDSNLEITGANNKVINISPSLLSLINSALKPGDNISGLINDANYITDIQLEERIITKQNLPTGFITGLELSINTLDNTKFDIAIGAYAITDFTDLENISVNILRVETPIVGITPTYLNTNNITYIALDENKNVIQKNSPFTNEERRTLAIIGAVIHSNKININVVNEIKAPIVAPTNQLHDLIRAIGSFNLEGNEYSANGTNLKLNKSEGIVFGLGINGHNFLNPNQLTISSQTELTFRYRLSNGTEYTDTSFIVPDQYESSPGNLTPLLNNNKWQIQRINLFQSGLTRIQPGQNQYDTLEEAIVSIKTENFIVETNIAENAVFRSYLIVKKNTTDLSDETQAKFIPVDKFGNVITSNTALTLTNIISALGYTPENESNKTTDFSTINDILYPSVEAVKEQLDLKQDTLVSGTSIKTVNSNSLLGSGDVDTTTQIYKTINSNTNLDDSYHNTIVWVTATCTITIPSGLRADFACTLKTFSGATATYDTSGTTINAESDGTAQSESSMVLVATYTTNDFIITGGGLS